MKRRAFPFASHARRLGVAVAGARFALLVTHGFVYSLYGSWGRHCTLACAAHGSRMGSRCTGDRPALHVWPWTLGASRVVSFTRWPMRERSTHRLVFAQRRVHYDSFTPPIVAATCSSSLELSSPSSSSLPSVSELSPSSSPSSSSSSFSTTRAFSLSSPS